MLAGCGGGKVNLSTGGIYDPYEATNRRIHNFNKGVDRAILAPVSRGYGNATPGGIRMSLTNFAHHLALPNDIINHILQGEMDAAVRNTGRFAMNTVVGFAGLFDPASDVNLPREEADFGQTLHKWGAAEGAYVEIPFLGPSNTRDAVGIAVDIWLNPFIVILEHPQEFIGVFAYAFESMDTRYEYDSTVNSILYQSADSYSQARSIYMQNRRYELGMSAEDLYFDPYLDDPYEDF